MRALKSVLQLSAQIIFLSAASFLHIYAQNEGSFTKSPTSELDNEKQAIDGNSFLTFMNYSTITYHTSTVSAGFSVDTAHPCYRACKPDTERMICHYTFKAEWYITLSKACYNCPYTVADCFRPHCVVADGFERPVVTVNRQIPGPSIQVCQGDEIVADIRNEIASETTSIHWHGIHQRGTPFMDGVPFLTQCPIQPLTTFRYHFLADLPGTHYWHSHSGFQRADGMFGSLIVRSKNDPHASLYDYDDPKHIIVVTDWMDKIGLDKFVNHHHTEHENKPYNILINGLGRYRSISSPNENSTMTPFYEFRVQQGKRYRFRTISNAVQNCPIQVSVDHHALLMIASDGQNIEPVEVESFVIYAGERWDFILTATQQTEAYWFKFKGLLDCDERFFSVHQLAVLRYEGSIGLPSNPEAVTYKEMEREGFQLNSLNAAPGDQNFITAAEIRNHLKEEVEEYYNRTPDYTFWINYDFYARNNEWFHHPEFYGFYDVVKKFRMYVPQLNNITLAPPVAPPLSQPIEAAESNFCNESSVENCSNQFCHCVHTLNVPLDSLVEIILVDSGKVYYANHPFHLHGSVFAVLGMERLGDNTTLESIKKLEKNGKLQRNFINPPLKDSITVPDGGYTVIRFYANNPGFWLFHCHLSFHSETGMGLVFHVGNQDHVPPVPEKFPKCGSWISDPAKSLSDQVTRWENELLSLKILSKHEKAEVIYNITKFEKNDKQLHSYGCSVSKKCFSLLLTSVILTTLFISSF